jgi:hypothetical protein
MNLLTKVIATSVLLVVLSLVTLRTEIGAQFISHLRPIFNALEFTETNNVVSHDSQIGGDNLNFTSNKMNWEGVRVVLDTFNRDTYNSLEFSDDFSIANDKACVGGTSVGGDCRSRCATGDSNAGDTCTTDTDCNGGSGGTCDADYDCTGGGTCTPDKQAVMTLGATVYREGREILVSDLPDRVLRIDASRTMSGSGGVDFSAATLNIPNSTSAVSTTAGRIHFDTNASPQPMISVGDGTNALPIRSCSVITSIQATNAINSNQPSYLGAWSSIGVNATPVAANWTAPQDMTLSNLSCVTRGDIANGRDMTMTVASAGGACAASDGDGTVADCAFSTSSLSCTITGTSGTSDNQCPSTTGTLSLDKGDRFVIQITSSSLANAPSSNDERTVQCTIISCLDTFD